MPLVFSVARLFSPPGPLTINPLIYSDVAFDPAKFVPITLMARVPNVLLVRNTLGAASVTELVALARANPGKLTYASQGVGSTAFLTAKLFEASANIAMVHVPYRGAAPALNDIVAGHVDIGGRAGRQRADAKQGVRAEFELERRHQITGNRYYTDPAGRVP